LGMTSCNRALPSAPAPVDSTSQCNHELPVMNPPDLYAPCARPTLPKRTPWADVDAVDADLGDLPPGPPTVVDTGTQTDHLAFSRLAPGNLSDSQPYFELFTNALETITTKFSVTIDSLVNKSLPDIPTPVRQELCLPSPVGRGSDVHELDFGAVLECVNAKLTVITEVSLPAMCEKVVDASVMGLAASVASTSVDLAEAQVDIHRVTSLVNDMAVALDAQLKSVVESTLPSLCDNVFERTAKLLLLLDGRVKTLETSSRLLAEAVKNDETKEKQANLLMMSAFEGRLLGLEASLLIPSGLPRDVAAPPLVAAEASFEVATFHPGQYIRLFGLSSVHLNGTIGCIVGYDDLSCRYQVQYNGKPPVKIKSSNIEVASCLSCLALLTSDVCFICGEGACSDASSAGDDAEAEDDDYRDASPSSGSALHPTSVQQSSGCVAARSELASCSRSCTGTT